VLKAENIDGWPLNKDMHTVNVSRLHCVVLTVQFNYQEHNPWIPEYHFYVPSRCYLLKWQNRLEKILARLSAARCAHTHCKVEAFLSNKNVAMLSWTLYRKLYIWNFEKNSAGLRYRQQCFKKLESKFSNFQRGFYHTNTQIRPCWISQGKIVSKCWLLIIHPTTVKLI